MRAIELIMHSIWSAAIGVLLVFAPQPPFGAATMPLGLFFFLPSVFTIVALTVASDWFQRAYKARREAKETRPKA